MRAGTFFFALILFSLVWAGTDEDCYKGAVRDCKARDAEACLLQAVYQEFGVGTPIDEKKSFNSYKLACLMGSAEACYVIGWKTYGRGSDAGALSYFDQACKKEHPNACAAIEKLKPK